MLCVEAAAFEVIDMKEAPSHELEEQLVELSNDEWIVFLITPKTVADTLFDNNASKLRATLSATEVASWFHLGTEDFPAVPADCFQLNPTRLGECAKRIVSQLRLVSYRIVFESS